MQAKVAVTFVEHCYYKTSIFSA